MRMNRFILLIMLIKRNQLLLSIFAYFITFSISAQLGNLKNQAGAAQEAANKAKADAEKAAAEAKSQVGSLGTGAFKSAAKDIQFMLNSANLQLDNPEYEVNGVNMDKFMKTTLLPALKKLDKVLPAGQKVYIIGHTNRLGSEEKRGTYIGNIELSRLRAKSVELYLKKYSGIRASRFKIIPKGSSSPLSGVDPTNEKNCRVSFDIGN